jgi:hypothetical protein
MTGRVRIRRTVGGHVLGREAEPSARLTAPDAAAVIGIDLRSLHAQAADGPEADRGPRP